MINEPNKLLTARAPLEIAVEDLWDPAGLGHLRKATSSLLELIARCVENRLR